MPPHCDSMDGPVVSAAKRALIEHNAEIVLPYVKAESEEEVRRAFEKTLAAHDGNVTANEVADLYFFETVVRLHRAGEGAPYTGLKPAGLPVGPVIPVAERAMASGSADELTALLTGVVAEEATKRFERAAALAPFAERSVDDAREYVEAALGLQVWAHRLYAAAMSSPHEGAHGHG